MAGTDRRSVLLAAASFALVSAACDAPAKKPAIKVYKDASCGCCTAWAELLTAAGFDVTIDDEGMYPFVSHAFADVDLGQVGLLKVGNPKGGSTH